MSRRATGSPLRRAVAGSTIIMTALSSAALAQQTQTPQPSWHGTFEWKHFCQGGGNTDETRGVGQLMLSYSEVGYVDRGGIVHPNWTLNGLLTGTISERSQIIPPCSFTYVAPGTFSARVHGSYTPAQNKFSASVYEVNSTPGRAIFACPQAPHTEVDQAYFTVYEGPMFEDAFRELRRQPDGSMKSSGERTVSVGPSTCKTTYSLVLSGDCFWPDKGFVFYVGTNALGGLHQEPTFASAVLGRPAVGGRYVFDEKRTTGGQTWVHVQVSGAGSGWLPASALSCARPTVPPPPRPSRQPPPWDAELNPGPADTISPAYSAGARG